MSKGRRKKNKDVLKYLVLLHQKKKKNTFKKISRQKLTFRVFSHQNISNLVSFKGPQTTVSDFSSV